MLEPVIHVLLFFAALLSTPEVRTTHYGPSYNDQQMGCNGSGVYRSENPVIIAAGYDTPFECGDVVLVSGPHGAFIGFVVDRCPGCGTGIDLSEAGMLIACGRGGVCYTRAVVWYR